MKIALISLFLLTASLAAPTQGLAFPACTSANEGQTVMLSDGQGPAQVYVCQKGAWIPATTR